MSNNIPHSVSANNVARIQTTFVARPSMLKKGSFYILTPFHNGRTFYVFFKYLGSKRPRGQAPRYVFEYTTVSGVTRTKTFTFPTQWGGLFRDERGQMVEIHALRQTTNAQAIRRNVARRVIGRGMMKAWINPHTEYGKRRLLREFKNLTTTT